MDMICVIIICCRFLFNVLIFFILRLMVVSIVLSLLCEMVVGMWLCS